MTAEHLPEWLVSRVRRDPAPVPGLVVAESTPVVCFGDQRTATVATLGINPSAREFLSPAGELLEGAERRLETLRSLGAERLSRLSDDQVDALLLGDYDYFKSGHKPYRWFDYLKPVLAQVGASYEMGTACHLDIVQWATVKKWGDVDPALRTQLIAGDEPFLVHQLTWDRPEVGRFRLVLVNGKTCIDQCRSIGIPWSPLDDLIVNDRKTRFYRAEWHGVRLLGWTANLPNSRTPEAVRLALPGHVAGLLQRLGWAEPTPAGAAPVADLGGPVIVPIPRVVAGLVDDLTAHGAEFTVEVTDTQVALRAPGDTDPTVLLDNTGLALALSADEAERLLASCPARAEGIDAHGRRWVHIGVDDLELGQVRGQVLIFALRALFREDELELDDPVACDELADAIVESVRFESWPPDMAEYWRLRRQVLTDLLTADLPPLQERTDPEHPWRSSKQDRCYLLDLVNEAARDRLELTSPLRRYLESPQVFAEIANVEAHLEEFARIDDRRDAALHSFMLDVLEHAYPGITNRHTTHRALLARGVAPVPPRDAMQLAMDGLE